MHATDLALVAGATLRLTRLIATDDAGKVIRDPARWWATPPEHTGFPEAYEWRSTLVDGLECPFCVGYWLGAGVLISWAVAQRHPLTYKAWRLAAASLALNELVGHAAIRLGDA